MFFKKSFSRLIVASVIIFTTACGSYLNDKPSQVQSQISPLSQDSQCLSDAPATLRSYFNGTASEKKLASLWDCAHRSVDLFIDFTKGAKKETYQPEELRSFLEKYFLKGNKISDSLLSNAMKFKSSFVGGSREEIRISDLRSAQEILMAFKEASLKLNRYQPITPASVSARTEGETDALSSALIESSLSLSVVFRKFSNAYAISDFEALLKDLKLFIGTTSAVDPIDSVLNNMVLFVELKTLLISPDRSSLLKTDWEKIILLSSRFFSLYLKTNHLAKNHSSLLWGKGLERMKLISNQWKSLLIERIDEAPEKIIRFEQIDRIVDAIGDESLAKVFYKGITSTSLKAILRPVVSRGLGGSDFSTKGRAAPGITSLGIKRIFVEINRFFGIQTYLTTAFESLSQGRWSTTTTFSATQILDFKNRSSFTGSSSLTVTKDMETFLKNVTTYKPFFNRNPRQISFYGYKDAPSHSFHNLFMMNWMQSLYRLLVRGYSENQARSENLTGVTQTEFSNFVSNFLDLGIEFKVFDPDSVKSSKLRFSEANLFTFAANGDELLDVNEGSQLLAYVFSSKVQSDAMYANINPVCNRGNKNAPLDFYGEQMIPAPCFLEQFFLNPELYWKNQPKIVKFYLKLNQEGKADFRSLFDRAIRTNLNTNFYYDTQDMSKIFVVSNYIETLFAHFDEDESDTITIVEAEKCYPLFRGILSRISPFKDDDDKTKTLFFYLLKHGSPPDKDSFWDKVDFARWAYIKADKGFEANRQTVLSIFATIGSQLK